MDLNQLLQEASDRKASDLHLKVGSHPILRIHGELCAMTEKRRFNQQDLVEMAKHIMNENQRKRFNQMHELDLAYSVPGLGRFRCNVFQQRGTISMVARLIPVKIKTISELNLPPILEKVASEERGLVLVTGTTGSGKSTTLAAMIEYINSRRNAHIVTIEDPIEFLHRDKESVINQREVGYDTSSFSVALKSALRQDPDIILVGEMRDFDTIETALVAAETGHLVFSTLHTVDATETVNRVISVFPPHQQKQIRLQLAAVLKAVVSMRLLPSADGKGRVPAVEVMVSTGLIRECIIEPDRTRYIPDAIEQGLTQYGMQSFDQSLTQLLKRRLITFEEALRRASNPDDFKLKCTGIQTTKDYVDEQEISLKLVEEESQEQEPKQQEEVKKPVQKKTKNAPDDDIVVDFSRAFQD